MKRVVPNVNLPENVVTVSNVESNPNINFLLICNSSKEVIGFILRSKKGTNGIYWQRYYITETDAIHPVGNLQPLIDIVNVISQLANQPIYLP